MAIVGGLIRMAAGVSMTFISGISGATPITFDYSDATPGTTLTPFSQTVGGVTATFTSDQDPGGFEVDSSSAATFSGLMIDTSFGNATLATELQIVFGTPVASISLPFLADGSGPLNLQAFTVGGVLIGSTSASGTIPPFPAQFPEGVISFTGADIQSVLLTDPGDPAFAIGALTVTPQPSVPEPAAAGYLALGLMALGALYRARRKTGLSGPRRSFLCQLRPACWRSAITSEV